MSPHSLSRGDANASAFEMAINSIEKKYGLKKSMTKDEKNLMRVRFDEGLYQKDDELSESWFAYDLFPV